MADVTLPQLGETVTEGTITQWFKAVGDAVEIDEPLFEVSTDKVDSEVPSPASGVLTEIRVPEGETVDVGTVLAVVGDAADASPDGAGEGGDATATGASSPAADEESQASGATAEEPADEAPAPSDAPARAPAEPAPAAPRADDRQTAPAQPTEPGSDSSVLLSPVVRSLVNEHGLDPSTIAGTGPGGRITRGDVEAVIDAQRGQPAGQAAAPASTPGDGAPRAAATRQAPAQAAGSAAPAPRPVPDQTPVAPGARDTVEPFNKMRRLTGEHMVYSKAVAPHVLMTSEVDYEAVEVVRRRHGAAFEETEGFSLSYLPFITMAVVDAIRDYPYVNASVGDGSLIVHGDINLGIAVDLHHEGLIVPVIRGADGLRLRAVAREIKALAERARSNSLSIDDITGGTFTISNPGPYGTHFTGAIISQPEVAILSTEGVSRKPVVVTAADGSEGIGIHSVGLLALSFDHRAFDGAYAAAFLARIKDNLETRDWEVELA
jgi:2-oxoglutarate dehydrogenase E2 component (dihydrolipoamide succinyltransferase)